MAYPYPEACIDARILIDALVNTGIMAAPPDELAEPIIDFVSMEDPVVSPRVWIRQGELLLESVKTNKFEHYITTTIKVIGDLTPQEKIELRTRIGALVPKPKKGKKKK